MTPVSAPKPAWLRGSVEKILFQHEIFGHQRFLMQFSVGTLPHEKVLRAIELFGTEVAPAVRREVRGREGALR